MMNKFVFNKTVHYMHFSSSYYLQIIFFINVSFYLFFHLDVIHKLPFSISMLFNRLPFSISILFTGSLFRFTCYLQAPFVDLRVVYSLLFFHLHVTDMLFTVILQPPLY